MKTHLSILLVTLPLAVSAAHAETTAAEEAVRLLSSAQAADRKCGYLDASERQELSRYTARAEIAAASQSSSKAARNAADRGAKAGRASTCSATVEADVRETLVAAREAVAAANGDGGKKQEIAGADAKKLKRASAMPKDVKSGRSVPARGGLRLYSRVVNAYYLERECLSLSRAEGKRFWTGIARLHREVLAQNGRAAVARVMTDAERNAQGSSCGDKVLAQIERGYEEIASRR